MAYDQTPTQDTHSTRRIPVLGRQTVTGNIRNYSAQIGQRFVNCFPVTTQIPGTDTQLKLVKAPTNASASLTISITPGTTGLVDCWDNDTFLFCKDKYIYELLSTGDIALKATDATADTVFKSIQRFIDYSGGSAAVVGGLLYNSTGWLPWTYTYGGAIAKGAAVVAAANTACIRTLFIDGYHVIADLTTGRVYNSSPGAYTTFALSTDYFVPETESDPLIDIHKHKNMIVCLGTRSVEFFYNNANATGSPFSRQEALSVKIGCLGQTSTVADGDDIYFIGNGPNSGVTVYRIRNYRVEQISDDYIQYIFNNLLDIGNQNAIGNLSVGMVDIMGNVCFAFSLTDADGTYRTFIYNEQQQIWWEWAPSDSTGLTTGTKLIYNQGHRPIYLPAGYTSSLYVATGYFTPDAGYVSGGSSSGATQLAINSMTLNSSSVDFTYFSKNPSDVSRTAETYTDLVDFGSNNMKHWKWVDLVGDYGNNDVDLAWNPHADYATWTSLYTRTPQTIGSQYRSRWVNLGRYRRLAFRLRIRGTDPMAHQGLETGINVGMQ